MSNKKELIEVLNEATNHIRTELDQEEKLLDYLVDQYYYMFEFMVKTGTISKGNRKRQGLTNIEQFASWALSQNTTILKGTAPNVVRLVRKLKDVIEKDKRDACRICRACRAKCPDYQIYCRKCLEDIIECASCGKINRKRMNSLCSDCRETWKNSGCCEKKRKKYEEKNLEIAIRETADIIKYGKV